MKRWFEVAVLWLTHKLWNRNISRILGRAYSARVINSQQMHVLAAAFDPTQAHKVYGPGCRIPFSSEVPAALAGLHVAVLVVQGGELKGIFLCTEKNYQQRFLAECRRVFPTIDGWSTEQLDALVAEGRHVSDGDSVSILTM